MAEKLLWAEMSYVYVLKSKKYGRLYIGSTLELKKRLMCHNSGKVRSTKSRKPFELIYSEEFSLITEARQRENFFKSGQGRKWIKEQVLIKV